MTMKLTATALDQASERLLASKRAAPRGQAAIESVLGDMGVALDVDLGEFLVGLEQIGRDLYARMSELGENRGTVLAGLVLEGLILGLQLRQPLWDSPHAVFPEPPFDPRD